MSDLQLDTPRAALREASAVVTLLRATGEEMCGFRVSHDVVASALDCVAGRLAAAQAALDQPSSSSDSRRMISPAA